MSSPALLEFLATAIRGHATRGPSGATRVIRVLVVDTEIDSQEGEGLADLLAGIASYTGSARAVGADTAETRVALPDTDPDLRGALIAATQLPTKPGAPLELSIDESGVRLSEKEVDILSPGERELIGVVAALLDPAWTGNTLGIVTYSEESMDPWVTRAAWDAVSVALADKQIGDLQTLIVIVRAAAVDTGLHCPDEWGADWVVDEDRLVRRGPIESARQHASEVVQSSYQPTVLYLGAGFSFSSDLPSGNELRDRALREYYSAAHEAPIEPLARTLFQRGQEAQKLTATQISDGEDAFVATLTLEDVIALVKELTTEPPPTLAFFAEKHASATPGPAVTHLASLLGAITRLVIVTVNFDELVEGASADGSLHPVISEDEFRDFPGYLTRYLRGEEASVPLLKLHGTISNPASCVVSAMQTRQGLIDCKADALRALARSVDASARPHWVYLGTSLRDKDIVPVLRELIFSDAFEESWVMPLRARGVDDLGNARAHQWQEGRQPLDKRSFSVSADTFARFMAEAAPPTQA